MRAVRSGDFYDNAKFHLEQQYSAVNARRTHKETGAEYFAGNIAAFYRITRESSNQIPIVISGSRAERKISNNTIN